MIGQSYIYIIDTEQKLNILILYRTWTNSYWTETEHMDTEENLNKFILYRTWTYWYCTEPKQWTYLYNANPKHIKTAPTEPKHIDTNLYSFQYTCWYEPVQFTVYMLNLK